VGSLLKISEGTSLALHTMVLLAARGPRRVPTKQLAADLRASEAHLAKVLQRLVHVGLATSVRGPKGGFALARPAASITLLEVYEAIEGPLTACECLLDQPVCGFRKCILGGVVGYVNGKVRDYLAGKRLSQLRSLCGERK